MSLHHGDTVSWDADRSQFVNSSSASAISASRAGFGVTDETGPGLTGLGVTDDGGASVYSNVMTGQTIREDINGRSGVITAVTTYATGSPAGEAAHGLVASCIFGQGQPDEQEGWFSAAGQYAGRATQAMLLMSASADGTRPGQTLLGKLTAGALYNSTYFFSTVMSIADSGNTTFQGLSLFYAPNPGTGNLIASIAPLGTTPDDQYGNPVVPSAIATYNPHGAVVNALSMSQSAFFQYRDLGTAAQGGLILSVASVAGTDPVSGGGYPIGLYGVDPFGNAIQVIGSTIRLFNAVISAQDTISIQSGSGAVSPAIVLRSPEQAGMSGHLVMLMQATSPDGTHPGQFLIARMPTGSTLPTAVTNSLIEFQSPTAGLANPTLQIIEQAAADLSFGTRVPGDSANRFRFTVDGKMAWGPGSATQDTNLYRSAANTLQTDDAFALSNHASPGATAGQVALYSAAGVLNTVDDTGWDATPVTAQTDVSSTTVTAASTTRLSASFTIPADNSNVGTVWRLKCGGFGTWGSTQTAPTFIQNLGGTNINQVVFTASDFAINIGFDWEAELTYTTVTTGSGGTCRALLVVTLNNNGAGVTAVNSFRGVRQGGGITFNTTVSRAAQLNLLWASAAFGATITCDRATFERIGP